MASPTDCFEILSPNNATRPSTIHEEFHPAHAIVNRTSPFVSVRVAIATFVAAGVLIACISSLYGLRVADGLIIYAALGLPLLIACVCSRVTQLRQVQQRFISLADDVITFSTADETESCPVRECCWFFGKAIDDPGLSYQDIRQKALLIVFRSGRAVACGLTQPFYSQWLDTLRSKQCRKVWRQEGPLGVLFSLSAIVGFFAGGGFGQKIGVVIRDWLFPAPQVNQFVNLLPAGLFILGAWFGAVSPWFIPGWRRYTDREHQLFVRFAILLPGKLAILAGMFVGGNLIAAVVLVLFFATVLLVLTRLMLQAGGKHCSGVQPGTASGL